jgi:hypothetical protein
MTPARISTLVIAFKTLTLVLGGLVTVLATKAATRSGDRSLATLALGFGVVTVGSLAAGVADQTFGLTAGRALAVESGLQALGFGVVAYSLFVSRRSA